MKHYGSLKSNQVSRPAVITCGSEMDEAETAEFRRKYLPISVSLPHGNMIPGIMANPLGRKLSAEASNTP